MSPDRVIARLQARLDALRTGMADLAFELERKGRCDAADVVMLLDGRVRELAAEFGADMPPAGSGPRQPPEPATIRPVRQISP